MKKFKRTLSLLCLIMVACLVPMTVFAEESEPTKYDVWVAGTQVTSANAGDILGGGEASYDADTNTLTVSGNISATGDDHAIYAETTETLTVEIADDVKIDTSNSNGIYTINDLAIICGDLTITAAKKGIASWYGSVSISGSENSEITIKSGDHAINAYLNVNIDCDTLTLSSSNGRGIYCEDGGGNDGYVDISGGDITIDAAARDGIKKENGDITIDCDSLEVTANTNGTNGIYCDGSLSITADKANVNSHGIALCGNEAVNILCDNLSVISTGSYGIGSSNGAITLSGDDKSKISVEFYDYGIKTKNKIDIKCAELDVVSVSEYSNGIYSEENEVTITCSDIDVQANNNGIYGHDDVTIDCDTATIVGGTYGISTSGSIIITDGEFDIQSTDASEDETDYHALHFTVGVQFPTGTTVTAATEVDGTFVPYVEADNATYDHVKIGTPTPATYTVTFNSDGGSEVAPQTIEEGGKATKPADPTKDGFDFVGWTLEDKDWNFENTVTGDMTLVAVWKAKEVTPPTGDNSNILLWISLLFVSAAGVVTTTVYGKKRFSVK